MRPLRLEMVAIGPFLSKTTIDFDRFSKGDLFLVHGPTGIGKSFMFDAICYALFGETPSRRTPHLRSDYARQDIEPSIVFSFALESEVYRVTRKLAAGLPALPPYVVLPPAQRHCNVQPDS